MEAVWRPKKPKKAFHKVYSLAPHAYLLLPCSPQVLQGHCPLVTYAVLGNASEMLMNSVVSTRRVVTLTVTFALN